MSTPVSSFTGLASGIDWRTMTDQLVKLESDRILAPLQDKETATRARQAAWSGLSDKLKAVQDAAATLKDGSAFRASSVSVSQVPSTGKNLLTASGTGTVLPGSYTVRVLDVARAERIGGLSVTDPNASLNVEGQFTVNGHGVTVALTDSLATVRDKINAANAGATPSGVTATVVTASGTSRLMLAADATGAAGVQLAEVRQSLSSGRVLDGLGLTDGSASVANVAADGRVTSSAMTSATRVIAEALGVRVDPPPANIVVNGQAISVDLSANSLVDIVALINSRSPGAASVTTATNNGITSQQLAIQGAVTVDPGNADASRRTLEALGLFVGGRGASAQVVKTGAALNDAAGVAAQRGTLLVDLGSDGVGAAGLQAGDQVVLTGMRHDGVTRASLTHTVTGTETLGDLLDEITAAYGGTATATLDAQGHITLTDGTAGDSGLAMSLTAGQAAGSLDFAGSVVTRGVTRELTAGTDAILEIDGQRVTSSTNKVSDAIPGVVMTALAADPATVVSVDVAQLADGAVNALQKLVGAYNEARAFVDTETGAQGRLPSSGAAREALAVVKEQLLADVQGLDPAATYRRGGAVGLSLQKDGTLKLDTDAFRAAFKASPAAVQAVFASAGSADVSDLQYVGAGSATPAGSYDVAITTAATRTTAVGAVLGTYATPGTPDQMTITDTASGKRGTIQLAAGDTVDGIVTKLNGLFAGQGMGLRATSDAGRLRISAIDYGSAAGFSIAYTAGSGGDGTAALGLASGSYANGLDVQGTVNGVAAAGTGQVLTAVNGLTIRHTGTTPTSGHLGFTLGLGGAISRAATDMTAVGGPIAAQGESLAASIDSLTGREADAQERLDRRKESLLRQFAAMETAMAHFQAQGQWLTGQLTALSGMTSSK